MRSVKINLPVRQAGTINLAILFFSLFLTLAVFSQISVANPKPTYDVGLNKADWLYYKTNNDITAYLGKKSSNLPTVRYQKGADYLEFSMTGVSSTTSVSLETDVKTPNTPTLFYRNVLDGADANYQITNIPFRVKEEIILKETFPTSHVGKGADLKFLFSAETSAKPVKQDDGSIAFFDDKGDYLFQLDKPFMIDANLNRSEAVTIEIVPKSEVLISNQISSSNNQTNQNRHPMSVFGQTFDDNNQLFKQFKKFKQFFPVLDLKNWNLFRNFSNIRQNRHPMSVLGPQQYTLTLKADSEWLYQATYPVIIDPTVTHNADANFTGQMNRIADSDSTTSTQLESSYPEVAKDPYTVLLLHFNEANGTQTGIRDYASTTRVITANGNASTTSYVTQLGLGNSAAFDGTGDYLSMPDSEDWNFGSGDFSVSFWINWVGDTVADYIYYQIDSGIPTLMISSQANGFNVGASNASAWDVVHPATFVSTTLPTVGKWYHFALVRDGSTARMFINGVQENTASMGATALRNSTGSLFIASESGTASYVNGYLDSLRILKGRALTPEEIKAAASRRPYAVYTSSVLDATASVAWNTLNWTEGGVKTGDGETLYNSSGLVAQWNFNETSGTTADNAEGTASLDGTLNGFSYTASRDEATTTTGWTANNKKWGAGSLMMESAAAADYISITDPASNVLDPNSADLTIETWIKTSDASAEIFSNNNGNGTACASNGYYLGIDANGYPVFYLDTNGATAGCDASTTSQFKINDGNWHKVAVSVTRGTSAVIYVDGKSAGSDTSVTSYSAITVTGNAFFGGSAGGLDAILDSTRFYSRALSASEILSNYNAGNIEIQTRTGATSDPNDGTWEAWKPTTGETQLLSMDSDKGNWNAPEQIDGYTKLLLHMDGTDTATTFPNSATTTHTVTANGNAQVDTAQSKFGGGSGLFDGTGDYLSVPDSGDWALGGTFTVDAWVRFNTIVNNVWIVGQGDGVVGANFWTFYYGVTTLNFLVVQNSATIISISNSWTPVVNRWYHVAVVDNGGTWKLFVDGVQLGTDGSDADTVHDISFSMFVGADVNSASHLNGWLDELRISKGIARWTSNFTPPPRAYGSNVKAENETTIKQEGTGSAKLTLGAPQVDGNTAALWHFEETGTTTGTYLYDETANNNDATTTGTTVVDGIFGKARKFNGNGDFLRALDNTSLDFGTGDFTVDFWVRLNSIQQSGSAVISRNFMIGKGGYGDAGGWVITYGSNDGTTAVDKVNFFNNATLLVSSNANDLVVGQWYHIAVKRSGTSITLFINGNQVASGTSGADFSNGLNINIGQDPGNPASNRDLNGYLDSIRIIKGRALSADEIAESYRMGANHHLTRQVSAVDLSAQTKLAFNVASDRPGTYLEAMLGESDYANYELASSTLALSTTTVLYIKGDEIASSTSIKDSSFSGKAITANGNARTAGGGKIGNSVYFDGTGDYLTVAANADWNFGTGDWAIDLWHKSSSDNSFSSFISLGSTDREITIDRNAGKIKIYVKSDDGTWIANSENIGTVSNSNWQHLALVRNGNTVTGYVDGVAGGSWDVTGKSFNISAQPVYIGLWRDGINYIFIGNMDEIRVIKGTALTPDQIRQAYEYGLRTHQITIDFGATLQTSDLISNSTDYNFNITATTSGLSATTSGLYLGDKIIIKENLGGTEYTAQGTVNAINTTTGAITVPSWDTGSTFPASNGYSPNATVFKWQREYFDLTGAATTTRNAITNLTLRPTNNGGGRTIYLDDFRYNTNYLTASSSSAITSSNNRYLQYRTIFSSWDSFVSPYLSAISAVYSSTANMFAPLIGVSGGGFLSF